MKKKKNIIFFYTYGRWTSPNNCRHLGFLNSQLKFLCVWKGNSHIIGNKSHETTQTACGATFRWSKYSTLCYRSIEKIIIMVNSHGIVFHNQMQECNFINKAFSSLLLTLHNCLGTCFVPVTFNKVFHAYLHYI